MAFSLCLRSLKFCSVRYYLLLVSTLIDLTLCLKSSSLQKSNELELSDAQSCFIFEEYFLSEGTSRLMLQCVGDGCSQYVSGKSEGEFLEEGSVLKSVLCEYGTNSCQQIKTQWAKSQAGILRNFFPSIAGCHDLLNIPGSFAAGHKRCPPILCTSQVLIVSADSFSPIP
jgi:hypothetical protein